MKKPISLGQKKFIEKAVKNGEKSLEIAQELGVSIWTVRKWRSLLKKGLICQGQWAVLSLDH